MQYMDILCVIFGGNIEMNHANLYSNLIEVFDKRSKEIPDNIAVICLKEQIAYKEIYEKSVSVSNKLLGMEIRPNDIVGLMMNRNVDMISTMIGILRVGASLLPIDKDFPEERIKYILSNSKCTLLLSDEKDRDYGISVLGIENLYEERYISNHAGKNKKGVSSDNIAYVMYTSGSTGKPKGVMISHRAILAFIDGITRLVKFGVGKRILAVATISFDLSIVELVVSLTLGMTIVLAQEHTINNSRRLLEYIKDKKVDILQMTPSRMSLLIEASRDYSWLEGTSEILLGGERFPEKLAVFLKNNTNARIYNLYGPTETTIYCTGSEIGNKCKLTVGKPFYGTQIYVLDEEQNEVSLGMEGEIYIGGMQLAEGYISNYELTNNSFINKNNRLYKSGDIGKIDDEGNLIILGRSDEQVKIRGFRVETNEIAEILNKYEKVKQAVVVAEKGKNDNSYLCAYYIGNEEISVRELRSYLKKYLAYYMIPEEFIRVDRFPETLNHKIDKRRLTISKNIER